MTQPGLRKSAVKSLQWTVAGRLLKSGLGIVTLVIVARYLGPAEFGIVALVMFITGFGQVFVDAGLRMALVQRIEISELEKNTVFWTSLAFSMLLSGVILLFAGPIARAFDAEPIEPFVRWMTLVFPLGALQSVSTTTLERKFAFARIAIADIASALAGAITAIGMVIAGFGITALIMQQLVQATVACVVVIAMAQWRPRLQFGWAEFRSLSAYAAYIMMTNVVKFLTTQLDRPLVAGLFNAQILGYLTLSQQVVIAPFKVVVQVAHKVLFPILASVQTDRARVGTAYLDIQFGMALLMVPAFLGIAATAHPLVGFLLGAEWIPAIPLIQLTAIQMLWQPIQNTNQVVLSSLGFAKFQFYWTLVSGVLSLGALVLAVPWGIEAAVAARVLVIMLTTPLLSAYTMRQMDMPPKALLNVLAGPLVAGVAMGLVVSWTARRLTLPDAGLLAVCVPLGVTVYIAILLIIARHRTLAVFRMLGRSRR